MPKGRSASSRSFSASKRDARWLELIAEHQDEKALSDIFEIYGPKLKGWLMARGVEAGTAEDIIQDVMIKVWTKACFFDPEKASFATWIYRLTRNRLIDYKRKHRRMDIRDPDIMKKIADDEVPSAEDSFLVQESAQHLNQHIHKLSKTQQMVIQMAFMEFKTHREIAEETGLSVGTVKTRIRSAIKVLRKNMKR